MAWASHGCATSGLISGFGLSFFPASHALGAPYLRTWADRRKPMQEQIKKKLSDEIAALEHELNHELPKELKKAVALGDLSENAEYHMAKQRQEIVRARLGQLKKRMADLSLVNMNNIPRDRASLGSTVKVYDSSKDEEIQYKLVTSEESDISQGMISTTSP